VHTLRLVFLFVLGITAAVAAAVWKSRHDVEVWHVAADAPS
jgi:beta-lactam-binding protein with PASTA domain